MTSPVITLPVDAPITEVVRLMTTYKIKRIPIIDTEGRFVGMVGRAGGLAALSRKG
ncbi:CBS domain-containing protein [Roseiflexus sp.]|uniref:CBS domain-containing protein n=1 Tax=Roseiflexus sp. TaxID=2562120 RepID=UPI00398B31D5